MGPKNLIDRYWVGNQGGPPATGWRFPPAHGFITDSSGNAIEQEVTVLPGKKVQLFGNHVDGPFLAPAGTPYRESAIPPRNLATSRNPFHFNYHLLVCQKTVPGQINPGISAEEGNMAPFQQPAGRTQDWVGHNDSVINTVGKLTKAEFLEDITNSPITSVSKRHLRFLNAADWGQQS
jgi:hypothetical protein